MELIIPLPLLNLMNQIKEEMANNSNDSKNQFIEVLDNKGEKIYVNKQFILLLDNFRKDNIQGNDINNNSNEIDLDEYPTIDYENKNVLIPRESVIKAIEEHKENNPDNVYIPIILENKGDWILVLKKDLDQAFEEWKYLNEIKKINSKVTNKKNNSMKMTEAEINKFRKITFLPEEKEMLEKLKFKKKQREEKIRQEF